MLRTNTFCQVLLISLIILLSTSQVGIVSAGINVWTSNGPEGESINVLVIDPATPTILYAGTKDSGVFKSTNGGENWNAINTGLASAHVIPIAASRAIFRLPAISSQQTKGAENQRKWRIFGEKHSFQRSLGSE